MISVSTTWVSPAESSPGYPFSALGRRGTAALTLLWSLAYVYIAGAYSCLALYIASAYSCLALYIASAYSFLASLIVGLVFNTLSLSTLQM